MNVLISCEKNKKRGITTLHMLFITSVALTAGLLLGRYGVAEALITSDHALRDKDNRYQHINPLLECNPFGNVSNHKVQTMKALVGSTIQDEKDYGNVDHVSVYFRDLNNGPWFGIGEGDKFMPGSLLKVPFMIALFKIAEHQPFFLSKQVVFHKKDSPLMEYFKPEVILEEGKMYTIEELIRRMIVYSDNDATLTLLENVDQSVVSQTYSDLGIQEPTDAQYQMSVQTYASFFRILYNATYLNREFSEKALMFLDEATFSKGIISGVPKDVRVANKFGERWQVEGGEKQLHDCGIVYVPDQPYVLCLMTRGQDFETLTHIMSKISEEVYKEISAEK